MPQSVNRVVQLRAYGGPECLQAVDLPLPQPGFGEVRVRVLASSINYTETLIRRHSAFRSTSSFVGFAA